MIESPTIKLLIVDDHAIVREGLIAILNQEADFQVVGEAMDGNSALEAVARLQPTVVLLICACLAATASMSVARSPNAIRTSM